MEGELHGMVRCMAGEVHGEGLPCLQHVHGRVPGVCIQPQHRDPLHLNGTREQDGSGQSQGTQSCAAGVVSATVAHCCARLACIPLWGTPCTLGLHTSMVRMVVTKWPFTKCTRSSSSPKRRKFDWTVSSDALYSPARRITLLPALLHALDVSSIGLRSHEDGITVA